MRLLEEPNKYQLLEADLLYRVTYLLVSELNNTRLLIRSSLG